MFGMVHTAGQCDFGSVDGRDLTHQPGLAVVGLHLAHLLGALGVDLHHRSCANRLRSRINLAHGGDGIAYFNVRWLDGSGRIAAALSAFASSFSSLTAALAL